MTPKSEIVEVLCNGDVCAAIYAASDKTIKLVSAHFAGNEQRTEMPASVRMDDSGKYPPVPALLITFDPRPYRIGVNGIVRKG